MKITKIAAVLLVSSILCFSLSFGFASLGGAAHDFPSELVKKYSLSSGSVRAVNLSQEIPGDNVEELEIRTVSTNLKFNKSESSALHLNLSGKFHLKDDKSSPLKIERDGQRLILDIGSNLEEHAWVINWDDSSEGNMSLTIPLGVKKIKVKTISGDIHLDPLTLDKIELTSVSGSSTVEKINVNDFQYKSVSGALSSSGKIQKFSGKSVSGGLAISFTNKSPEVEVKTTSGDNEFRFQEQPDLSVEFSSVSGSLEVSPIFGRHELSGRKMALKLGNGSGSLAVKTVSGGVRISKSE